MPVFVNNIEITDEKIHQEMQYHSANDLDEARFLSAKALVVRQLFILEAVEEGLLKTTDTEGADTVEKAIELLLSKYVHLPELTEEMLKTYYQSNKKRFKDSKTNKNLPFELVKHLIENYLNTQSMRTGASQYIHKISSHHKLVGINIGGSSEGFTHN